MRKQKFGKILSVALSVAMVLSLGITVSAAEPADDLSGAVVILHTNDVHGAIDGYAKAAALKKTYGGFDRENTLKKVPNGYPKDFPYPELLKLKSFGVVYKAKDDFFYDRKWIEKVAEYFRPAKAMNDFFNYTADEMYNR